MMRRIGVFVLVASLLIPPRGARAASFDPDFIISDAEATEIASLDAAGVQRFLVNRGSALASYEAPDIEGTVRPASDIIMRAALAHRVSPRLLLALLQREQSLLISRAPSEGQLDWAAGWGVCDACSTGDPALQKFRGFGAQLDYAASGFRFFMDEGPRLRYLRQRDVTSAIDGVPVTPRSWATAHLYNYTPHLQAQRNFWSIWQTFFVRRYPNGSLVTAPGIPGTWIIRYGKRRKVASVAVLASLYDPGKVVSVGANDLLAYDEGPEIRFPNYSLIRSPRGTVFLLVDDERRGISSREVFRSLGFNPDEVVSASWDDVNAYREGPPITLTSAYPFGALVQDPATGGVYFAENGVKHPLIDRAVLDLYFKSRRIRRSSAEELATLTLGEPISLRDGELVKTPHEPTVYVIADGLRLPIVSGDLFEAQGWRWENVKTVPERVLALHSMGPPFDPELSEPTAIATPQD